VAEAGHHAAIVRDEEHRAAATKLRKKAHALLLEGTVAHRERLVHHQHVRLRMRHHRKRQPRVHPARIVLHRLGHVRAPPRPHPHSAATASTRAPTPPPPSPTPAAFPHTFSRPVNSGLTPAPSSNSAPTRPRTATSPRLGRTVPQISCNSVDFPEPFRPIRPTVSPRETDSSTSRTAQNSS